VGKPLQPEVKNIAREPRDERGGEKRDSSYIVSPGNSREVMLGKSVNILTQKTEGREARNKLTPGQKNGKKKGF